MYLLGTEKYRNELARCLNETASELIVLSAFVTKPGYQWIIDRIGQQGGVGKLVVRWRPNDLLSGASSLEVYEMAKKVGWSVFVYPDLHAKSILIDKSIVFVGSANMTGYGLSIVPGANRELGVKFPASPEDIAVFESILSESTLVTDLIVERLKEFLSTQPPKTSDLSGGNWSLELEHLFDKPPEKLWVADLLWAIPEDLLNLDGLDEERKRSAVHDLNILGLADVDLIKREILSDVFIQCRSWKWLKKILSESEGQELYFGAITAALHSSLLDDPTPYRKEVKGLVQNLYSWASILNPQLIKIDVPNHSQRIKYLG